MILADARLQLVLDLVGVFVFALSGGLVAVQRRLDLFGVLVLAVVAGLGGGILRDVLIGATPPRGLTDWRLLAAAALGGLVTFRWHPNLGRRRLLVRSVRVLDAAGLGAFCVSGALTALAQGAAPLTAVIVGTLTAIGGGMLRDVLAGQVPEVLRRELYAVPAALGATAVVVARELGVLGTGVALAAALGVAALRVLAVLLDLNAPSPLRTSAPSRAESRE
ncbi:trimeric intracellular cation channel family protein [Angustibacter aerolatus]